MPPGKGDGPQHDSGILQEAPGHLPCCLRLVIFSRPLGGPQGSTDLALWFNILSNLPHGT